MEAGVLDEDQYRQGKGRHHLQTHRMGRMALLAASAALAAGASGPAAASAAVAVSVTGDDGNPVPISGALNIRNMNPKLAITALATDYWAVSVTGPNGAVVSTGTVCSSGSNPSKSVDYIGNGAYTVSLTTYSNATCTAGAVQQSLPFTITASTALGQPQGPVLTRKAGSTIPNTVNLPIDLNPGALATEAFVERNVVPNPDGSLPGTPEQLFPDSTTRTVPVRLDKGPGSYVVAAHAKGYTGLLNPQTFGPWATPAAIKAFAPFDLQKFTWTDQRGPSYRLSAVIRATGASGRVSVAIGRGTKGKYRSYGSVKIRKHAFSKRFRLARTGKYRIRFKYKGNATVAPGFEVHRFQVTRRTFFRPASIAD
jgi:hypothetical protein